MEKSMTPSELLFKKKSFIFNVFRQPDAKTSDLTPYDIFNMWSETQRMEHLPEYKDIAAHVTHFKKNHWSYLYIAHYNDLDRLSFFLYRLGDKMPDYIGLRFLKREMNLKQEKFRKDAERFRFKMSPDKRLGEYLISRASKMRENNVVFDFIYPRLKDEEKKSLFRSYCILGYAGKLSHFVDINLKQDHSRILLYILRQEKLNDDIIKFVLNHTQPKKDNSLALLTYCSKHRGSSEFDYYLKPLLSKTEVSTAMQFYENKDLSVLIPYLSKRAWKKIKHLKVYQDTPEHQKRSIQDVVQHLGARRKVKKL